MVFILKNLYGERRERKSYMAGPQKQAGLAFHHVCIVASNYRKAVEFYVDSLGLEIYRESFSENRNAKKLELYAGGQYVVELFINEAESGNRPLERGKTGPEHVSFLTDNVGAMLEYLKSRGIPVTEAKIDKETGKAYGFCWDPDDTKIEFYQR